MSVKTYLEPETLIPIYDECDVLVVGGGSAGHSAAIAAARAKKDHKTATKRTSFSLLVSMLIRTSMHSGNVHIC